MTDPRAKDLRNPHYDANNTEPTGEDLRYVLTKAPGESWEEWSERTLRPEKNFPTYAEESR